jgi:hypothetical protein
MLSIARVGPSYQSVTSSSCQVDRSSRLLHSAGGHACGGSVDGGGECAAEPVGSAEIVRPRCHRPSPEEALKRMEEFAQKRKGKLIASIRRVKSR